jgi:ankyrin repeat protein
MDIGALLAASNLEVAAADSAYDTEEFEDEGAVDDNKNGEPVDKMAILKAAAAKVAVEEKRIADRVFNETADDLGEDIKSKRMAENDPEAILLNASRTVNEHYNRQDPSEADKFRAAEEKESDHEDEGEDDEGDDEGDPDMNQTLMLAVFNERLEAVKTALRKGAKFNARDRHGWTPLHWAASKGYEDIMECLIDHAKSNHKNVAKYVNAQDALTGWTPMHVNNAAIHAPACCV